jgi:hypothetical protein
VTDWWPSKALVALRSQIDYQWHLRDRRSDGTVGDLAHLGRKSDHNPATDSVPPGCVRAMDIDRDLDMRDPNAINRLVMAIHRCGPRDSRLSYIIFNQRIASRQKGWIWRPYSGANAHRAHAHISFTEAGDHDGSPFALGDLGGQDG